MRKSGALVTPVARAAGDPALTHVGADLPPVHFWTNAPGCKLAAMTRVGFCLGLVMIACGGAATPAPESPDTEKAPPAAAPKDDDTKATSDDAKSSDESPKGDDASGGGKTTSGDELKTVLQLVIEDAELDKYLHLEEPGRFPLKMSGKDLPGDIALTKAGQPVKMFEGEPTKKDAVLVITKIEIESPDATVGYRYDVEGVVGTAHLKKASYGWELQSSRIVEHYRSDDDQGSGGGEKKKKK